MAKYDNDATVMAFDVPEIGSEDVAPKKSAMTGKRPDLQVYDPYSIDPTISAFDPLEAVHELTSGPSQPVAQQPQGNPYIAQVLKRMLELRQGMQGMALSAVDLPASLPAQIGGGLTYAGARLGGAEPQRAQQLSEYVSGPLSYLEPGKLASLSQNNVIGQGSEAYQLSPISQVMDLIDKYGAQPAVEYLVNQGMNPQDAQQLVSNAPLLIAGGLKLGAPGIKAVGKLPAWYEEMKAPQAGQNVGAAEATPAAVLRGNIQSALTNASPELQQFVQSKTPEQINVPALETRALEEKHGIHLSTGQRTGDTGLYSQEWNNRGQTETLGRHFDSQPAQVANAFEQAKQRHAPDIPSTADASELGQHEINALAAKDKMRTDAINQAYKDLTDAGGGQFPIDVGTLTSNIASELSKNLKTNHLPAALAADLKDFAANPTLEGFEALRTNTANVMRSSADGNAKGAAYIVRQELEKLPVFGEENAQFDPKAAEFKQLADNARSLVAQRYSVLNNNPAYKAAVKEFGSLNDATSQGESLNAANFHKKFVANATPEAIRRMKSEIAPDDIAHQAITFAELDRAKNAAVNASDRNLKPDTFANFYKNNKSVLRESLPPGALQDVSEIGALTSKIGMPKTGTFNYSNTYSSMLSDMAKQGLATGAEAKLAAMTGGASLPATGLARQFLGKMNKEGFAQKAIDPFGGLTKE